MIYYKYKEEVLMKNRSFSVMYALRELKTRRKTFVPAILISMGTMILMLNVMIYIQSKNTSAARKESDVIISNPENLFFNLASDK